MGINGFIDTKVCIIDGIFKTQNDKMVLQLA